MGRLKRQVGLSSAPDLRVRPQGALETKNELLLTENCPKRGNQKVKRSALSELNQWMPVLPSTSPWIHGVGNQPYPFGLSRVFFLVAFILFETGITGY